ncbi:MAG TPA: aspartate/glutamate racemase family protein [Oceanospirillales bacterium]|nr:aspartate/glutamate racemase family protein [Oceanospirillales bacterium]
MKTIGLLGGMSWESTLWYYKSLNEGIKQQLGGLHSAKVALYSVDFDEIEKLQMKGDWQTAAQVLANAAIGIEKAGADFLLICTNTMHKVADEVQQAINIPLLHIADATAIQLKAIGVAKVGLLGTAFTMEQDFYKGQLTDAHGLDVIIPTKQDRKLVHRVIYDELCLGKINGDSKQQYLRIIEQLAGQGAEGVILGCTEIGLLVKQSDTKVKLFDTTLIHANSAVKYALQ